MKELKSMKMNDLKIYECSTFLHLLDEGGDGFFEPFYLCLFMSFLSFMVIFRFF